VLYRFLKILLSIGMYFYYKKVKVIHKERINVPGPKLLIANHPNTMMDAWILGKLSKEPIYFMTKGTFFNTPFKKWLLRSIGLIPINRADDSKTSGVSNSDSFEQCYQLLEQGKTLAIFPEGNSFAEKLLRKLKSGTARIALQTELRNNGELGVQIIPVGLVYLQPEKFRSSVLVRVGEAIDARPFLPLFKDDRLKAARQLTAVFRERLMELLVASQSSEQETLSDRIAGILRNAYARSDRSKLERDVDLIRSVNENLSEINRQHPEKLREIEQLVYEINWQIDRLKIKSAFLDRKYRFGMFMRQLFFSILALIIGFPIHILGIVFNGLPYFITDLIMPKVVRDLEYYASVAVLIGLILYPLNYLGFVYLFNIFTDLPVFWNYLVFFMMPLLGLFSYSFYHYSRHVSFKWKYILNMVNQKSSILKLRADRDELRRQVFDHSA
jgi:1-acyl-sn-glycerol-3-phosphate acyltransferase